MRADLERRLDAVRERLVPSEVIGRHVALKKIGREHRGLCPFHNEKTPSFYVADRKLWYHCFGCGAHGDVVSFVQRRNGLGFHDALKLLETDAGLEAFHRSAVPARQALDEETRRKREEREAADRAESDRKLRTLHGIWAATHALAPGGVVDRYLRGRAVVTPASYGVGDPAVNGGWPPDLRFLPDLLHDFTRRRYPALVAAIRDNLGNLVAVHRTYLVEADRGLVVKASFTEKGWDKLTLGRYVRYDEGTGREVGGSIRLGDSAAAMIGGEGIETSLSAMQIWKRPGLCFVSSSNMPNVELPFPCGDFLYAADKQPSGIGEKKAWQAARRQAFGRKVTVVIPNVADPKCDFNDVVQRHALDVERVA